MDVMGSTLYRATHVSYSPSLSFPPYVSGIIFA
jgi:hypothetical protein